MVPSVSGQKNSSCSPDIFLTTYEKCGVTTQQTIIRTKHKSILSKSIPEILDIILIFN
jgi:hypothetical protein